MLPHRVEAAKVFSEDIAPKILDLYDRKLPPALSLQLKAAVRGGLSPDLVRDLIPKIRRVIQRGQTAPIPTGTLDTLEKIVETADSVDFESATNLRTSLMEGTRGDDAILKDRAKALSRKFVGDLTGGMSATYPSWDPLRSLYAKGAEATGLPTVAAERERIRSLGPSAYDAAVKATTGTIPSGQEAEVLNNLRIIDTALTRARSRGSAFGNGIYHAFALAAASGLVLKGEPGAAAGSLAVSELMPGVIVWAAHSPTMTKLLQNGLTSRNLSEATALIGRVAQSYQTYRSQQQADASQMTGTP
jgi:hypothetical protein